MENAGHNAIEARQALPSCAYAVGGGQQWGGEYIVALQLPFKARVRVGGESEDGVRRQSSEVGCGKRMAWLLVSDDGGMLQILSGGERCAQYALSPMPPTTSRITTTTTLHHLHIMESALLE